MPAGKFDDVVLPHLDAAYNYARWLAKNDADAQDVVQDACVRALRFFSSSRGDNPRAWLLAIVRNAWYSRFARSGSDRTTEYDDMTTEAASPDLDPEAQAMQQQAVERVQRAIELLPADFREVVVLREIEGLSYKEIAAVVQIPVGTVMSRLARARERLLPIMRLVEAPAGGTHELS
jgi:RNA polymerase sigma factor (sigma-70 family)